MTKDWDVVQDEIRELSFNQKKSLEDVKELMEQKYKFRAS
jgi:Cdc6-like AAA superfamily ATPase